MITDIHYQMCKNLHDSNTLEENYNQHIKGHDILLEIEEAIEKGKRNG